MKKLLNNQFIYCIGSDKINYVKLILAAMGLLVNVYVGGFLNR